MIPPCVTISKEGWMIAPLVGWVERLPNPSSARRALSCRWLGSSVVQSLIVRVRRRDGFRKALNPSYSRPLRGVAGGAGAEMLDVARVDRRHRQHDQHVGGAELTVDHGAVADRCAEPQIALDQRRQGMQSGFV